MSGDGPELRAEHPEPPDPFRAAPRRRSPAPAPDEPPRRSRRKAVVGLVLAALTGVRLFERMVNGPSRGR